MKAQSAIEYLIIIGFVSVAVTTILALAYSYANMSNDKIRVNQIEALADKVISRAESVFYSGQPSQLTVSVYVPKGVEEITLSGKDLIIRIHLSTGEMKRVFTSGVNLEGSISASEGVKNLLIKAEADKVNIS